MQIEFATQIHPIEGKFSVVLSASVPTLKEAHSVEQWLKGAIQQAAGRQKAKQSKLILPAHYRQ